MKTALYFIAGVLHFIIVKSSTIPPAERPPLEIVDLRWRPKIPVVCLRMRFECETSNPDAVVWFTVDGSNVSRSTSEPLEALRRIDGDESNPMHLSTIWSLELECPQLVDSGDYECHAVLEDLPDSYVRRLVPINFIPTVVKVKVDTDPIVLTKLYDKLEISCDICTSDNESTSLLTTAKWEKDDRLLFSRSESLSSINDVDCLRLTVVLDVVQRWNVGLYSCFVPKLFGSVSSSTYVALLDSFMPSKPSFQLISNADALILWMPPPLPSSVAIRAEAKLSYRLYVRADNEQRQFRSVVGESLFGANHGYFWRNLSNDHFYIFEVAACVDKVNKSPKCGRLSEPTLITHFKTFARPDAVSVVCRYDNVSHGSILDVTWEAPLITGVEFQLAYRVQVSSSSRFVDVDGINRLDEQVDHYVSEKLFWRHLVTSNTNYSVRVCVVTSKGCGNESLETNVTMCSTPPSVPSKLPLFSFHNADPSLESVQLQLDLQRVTEREGPIRCYRVVLYKLRSGQQHLPDSSSLPILTYDIVHSDGGHGAYVAEAFDSKNFRPIVTLGDESYTNCDVDYNRFVQDDSTFDADRRSRRDVLYDDNETSFDITSTSYDPSSYLISTSKVPAAEVEDSTIQSTDASELTVYDGKLYPDTKYSGFVEVVVVGFDGKELKRRSGMSPVVRTSMGGQGLGEVALPAALGVICGLFAVILILIVALCVLRKRGLVSRQAGVPFLPLPSTKPIRRSSLVAAYKERRKDSDLIFQREYEMLPEYFNDRTSRSSDSVENFFKNRYPDIKAYDQTRVKLSVIKDMAYSDYINANYVQGFRNKKFICAQGPVDKTVNDFWRMIWEAKVEIVAMVTGLEENGKTKCAKYWPDEGEAKYEDLTVSADGEFVYGEYAVRRFTVRMGGSGGGGGDVTPGSKGEVVPDTLSVVQFHYLAWRDFLAPDHPGGILKFIKRIREVHKAGNNKGYILVHCSAGVGRTGTLVTIDSLLDQMEDEGQVDIFHFVAGIRRHRNFLVQSLTQYIFIYRALAEYAQFGDTEIETKDITSTLERLEKLDLNGKSFIKKEFEKFSDVLEDQKTTDVAVMDVNLNKNRDDHLVPFDNNRVVLTPLPTSSNSTYINASIIQGYDRSVAYIVTQDPLETTFGQFWRMIHEHCVPIIVMLSELVDDDAEIIESTRCPKYWPDCEETYDHIRVSRQDQETSNDTTVLSKFLVMNNKTSSSHVVTQIQFKAWTGNSCVPSSCRRFLNLLEQVHEVQTLETSHDPIAIHCSGGSERSGLFVALSILMHQATSEKRVDVFHVVSSLKTQRISTIGNLEQYRFCYNAIDEYIRLHELDK